MPLWVWAEDGVVVKVAKAAGCSFLGREPINGGRVGGLGLCEQAWKTAKCSTYRAGGSQRMGSRSSVGGEAQTGLRRLLGGVKLKVSSELSSSSGWTRGDNGEGVRRQSRDHDISRQRESNKTLHDKVLPSDSLQ